VLPGNVRLDWKVIARYKHYSLFGVVISDEGKKFYNIDTRIIFRNSLLIFFSYINEEEGSLALVARAHHEDSELRTLWHQVIQFLDL
jgi:hypothetical protein